MVGAMPAGYSGTPTAKKLGLEGGKRAAFVAAPSELFDPGGALADLPADLVVLARPGKEMDYLHLFATSRGDLERRFRGLADRLADAGMLWVSWPKKSSGVTSDLGGDVVRSVGLSAGLVDVKVCAIDETWSGLKFVRRRRDRARSR